MQIRCTQADHENELIMGFCVDSNCQSQRPYCHYCLPNHGQHLNKLILAQKLKEWIQTRISIANKIQKNAQECKSALDSLTNKLLLYYNFDLQQLGISQIDNAIKGLFVTELCEQSLFKSVNQSIEQVKSTINQILNNFINQLNSAFNQDNSIVVAGCNSKIKVFEFNKEQLKQIQLLSEHHENVTILNFMKKSTHLISGSQDKQFIIWFKNQYSQWICQQKLIGHDSRVNCLILNNNEDVIISGSHDQTVKFWVNQNQWACSQTITDHTDNVLGLNLNDQQNRVISCGKDNLILIIDKLSQDSKWKVIQKIKVDKWGYRLCFINDNQFTFQPHAREYMHVYEMNNYNKQYVKAKEILSKCGSTSCCYFFPQQYIKSKSLLVNKNGSYVNLIRNQNGEFLIQQSIDFRDIYVFGQISQMEIILQLGMVNLKKFNQENIMNKDEQKINYYLKQQYILFIFYFILFKTIQHYKYLFFQCEQILNQMLIKIKGHLKKQIDFLQINRL